jgi:hypothetical protein
MFSEHHDNAHLTRCVDADDLQSEHVFSSRLLDQRRIQEFAKESVVANVPGSPPLRSAPLLFPAAGSGVLPPADFWNSTLPLVSFIAFSDEMRPFYQDFMNV